MSGSKHLVIYHTADIHARRGFADALSKIVEGDALLVDCGDALAGSSVWFRRDEPVISELASAPYAAMAVGNREFHYLHRLFLARARLLKAPLVCSNVLDLRHREPPFVRELTVRAGEQRVRILSLLAPQYRTGSGWEKIFGWRFLAPDVALAELLERKSMDDIPTILLSHLGLPADRAIAARFPSLAAILGGHSHDALERPEIVNEVPIAHPGPFATHAGRLELSLDGGKRALESYRLLPLPTS